MEVPCLYWRKHNTLQAGSSPLMSLPSPFLLLIAQTPTKPPSSNHRLSTSTPPDTDRLLSSLISHLSLSFLFFVVYTHSSSSPSSLTPFQYRKWILWNKVGGLTYNTYCDFLCIHQTIKTSEMKLPPCLLHFINDKTTQTCVQFFIVGPLYCWI